MLLNQDQDQFEDLSIAFCSSKQYRYYQKATFLIAPFLMGWSPQLAAAAASPGREKSSCRALNIEQLICPSKAPDLLHEADPEASIK